MTIKAIIHKEDSGGFWAEIPALPGCSTQADTMEELESNIQEAVTAWMSAGEPEENSSDQVLMVAV